jgi:hypothetical protein
MTQIDTQKYNDALHEITTLITALNVAERYFLKRIDKVKQKLLDVRIELLDAIENNERSSNERSNDEADG